MTDIIDVNKETQLPVIPSLSEVDAENPKLVSQTLEAIKEAIEVRLGMRGDKLDQSPTWRDLYNNGTIDVILKGTVLSNTSPVTTFPIVGTVKDNIVPPAPAGLTAVGGFENILLLWTMPTYGNHSYTEIYRYDSDDIGQSVLVGTSNGHVFGDNVDIDSSYYYWIRFVSKGAVAGPFNATSGTFAETSASVADLLTDLDETLDATALSTTLRSTINSTFRQTAAPTEKNDGTALVAGDVWYDTDNGNVLKRYNGSAWVLTQDSDIGDAIANASDANDLADSKIRVFYANDEPVESTSNLIDEGDLWIDTDDDANKLHRYDGSAWQTVQDTGIASAIDAATEASDLADSKIRVFYANDAPEDTVANPTAIDTGDLWIDTNDGNKLYRYDGSAWQTVQDTAIASALGLADSKIRVFYADDEPEDTVANPTDIDTGDLWVDTNDANKLYRYDGSIWGSIRDTGITDAIDAATEASDLADSKIRVFYDDDEPEDTESNPTDIDTGDLWVDTDDANKLYRYDGSNWGSIRDTGITDAIDAATEASDLADSKVRIFHQTTAPADTESNPTDIDTGDLWIDTDGGNKLHRYDGSAWQPVQDTDIASAIDAASDANDLADSKIRVFYDDDEPEDTESNPTDIDTGDLWIDTDDANKLYRYDGSNWGSIRDTGIASAIDAATEASDLADSKVRIFHQTAAPEDTESNPTDIDTGDLWIDTDDDANKLHRYDGSTWQPVQDTDIASAIDAASDANDLADSKIRVFYDDDEPEDTESNPTDIDTGDLWIDTDDANKLYRYDGSNWGSIRDTGIASAIDAATEASDLADSKVRIFHQTTAPAESTSNPIDTGDLWIDTDGGNKLYRYDGSAWQTVQDTDIASALDLADSKVRIFHQTDEPEDTESNPTDIDTGDLWIDTDDGNKLYRYDGSTWQPARDTGIASALGLADSKIRVFYDDDEPEDTVANPTDIDTGDLWIDTDDGNKLYRYDGSAWQPARDTGIASAIDAASDASDLADSKVRIFHQTTAPEDTVANPTDIDTGDLWIDTDDGNKLYRYDGSAWQTARDTGIASAIDAASDANDLADSKIRVFYDAVAPVESSSNPIDEGDLWVDPDYKLWRYDDTNNNWLVTQDTDIGAALETAVGAAATADGKVVIFYQNAQPTGGDTGDLWFDTNDGDKAYKCTGHAVAYNSTYFSIPDGYPFGITKVGAQFYVCGKGGDKVYKFNSSYSNTSSWSLGSPDGDTVSSPSGIAYANGYLYIVDSTRKKVYRYTITGTYKDSFAVHSSVSYPSGICWDGSHFWITDYNNAKVYKHTLGGSYASAYFSCQTSPTDVTWDGSHFWVIHLNQDKLHEYTRDGTATGVSYSVTSHDTYPNGLYADGDKLWVTGHQQDKARQYVVSSEYELLNLATSADVDTKIIEQVGYCELTASNGDKSVATGLTTKTDCEAATPPSGGSYSWKDSGSIASEVKTVTSTVGGHTSTISTHTDSIDGVEAQYTVKIDQDGHIAGFGLASSLPTDTYDNSGNPVGSFSEFQINADAFRITKPDGSGTSPFTVATGAGLCVLNDGNVITNCSETTCHAHTDSNGDPDWKHWFEAGVWMNTALISDASIDMAKIDNLTVDFADVTGTLDATQIDAGGLDADVITSGKITSTFIDIDDNITFSSDSSGIVFGKTSLGSTATGAFYGRAQNGDGEDIVGFHVSSPTSAMYADSDGNFALSNVKIFAGSAGSSTYFTGAGDYVTNISSLSTSLAIELVGGGAGACNNPAGDRPSSWQRNGAAGGDSWIEFYDDLDGDGDMVGTRTTAAGGVATSYAVGSNNEDYDGASGKNSSQPNSGGSGGGKQPDTAPPTGSYIPADGIRGGGGGGAGTYGRSGALSAGVTVQAENGKTASSIITVPSGAKSLKIHLGTGGTGGGKTGSLPSGFAAVNVGSVMTGWSYSSGGSTYYLTNGANGGDGFFEFSDPNTGGIEVDLVNLLNRVIALENA